MCGIFGIYGHPQAALMTYFGLYALQHRGQESTGIVTCERDELSGKVKINFHKGLGLVADVFQQINIHVFQRQALSLSLQYLRLILPLLILLGLGNPSHSNMEI